jgi:hypothetical protein
MLIPDFRSYFSQNCKLYVSSQKISVRSRIRRKLVSEPDPGVKKVPEMGICNTAYGNEIFLRDTGK